MTAKTSKIQISLSPRTGSPTSYPGNYKAACVFIEYGDHEAIYDVSLASINRVVAFVCSHHFQQELTWPLQYTHRGTKQTFTSFWYHWNLDCDVDNTSEEES